MGIQENLKEALASSYGVEKDGLDVGLGNTINEGTKLVVRLRDEVLEIPRTDDTEDAMTILKNYLIKTVPTGEDAKFSNFHKALFKIEVLKNENGRYAIALLTDRRSATEDVQYLAWNTEDLVWEFASRKLQVFEKIRIKYGKENLGSIKIVQGSDFLVNPRAAYEDNTVEIPRTLRSDREIRNVRVVAQEPYRIELEVDRVAIVATPEGEKMHTHRRRFEITKKDNRPIRISQKDLDIPAEWNEAFKSELDFEMNPVNTAVHYMIEDTAPKYDGARFYITASDRIWVNAEDNWFPVAPGYLKYLNIEAIRNEEQMVRILESIKAGDSVINI